MEYQNFKLEIDEQGIAVFTANRPENQFFTWADKADEVKVIIVTGAGEKAFIAGADLNSLKTKKSTDCLGGAGQKALDLIQKCSKPVIAAVNGYAFGGGCETAIACDFRVVSEDALFALPETGLGLLPGAGGTQRLARLIGLGRAQDVILLGRKIGGPEAVQIGLAIRIAKRVVQASMSSSQDVGELLEMLSLSTLCSTEDKLEGVSSFLEKRTPEYKGK